VIERTIDWLRGYTCDVIEMGLLVGLAFVAFIVVGVEELCYWLDEQ
jgi:hypothetical protein